jgi:hypothetical protein
MPFEKGNQLAASHYSFNAALRRAIDKKNLSRKEQMDILEEIADKMLDRALESKADATEIADRLDGKAKQAIDVDATVSGQLNITNIARQIVDPNNPNT